MTNNSQQTVLLPWDESVLVIEQHFIDSNEVAISYLYKEGESLKE